MADELNIIAVFPGPVSWLARFSGPHAENVRQSLDSNVAMTPFTLDAPVEQVISDLQRRFPDALIRIGFAR